jgi:hypothetical protein
VDVSANEIRLELRSDSQRSAFSMGIKKSPRRRVEIMSITDVPVLPFRASRHLATWIVWHAVRVSLIDDSGQLEEPKRKRKR